MKMILLTLEKGDFSGGQSPKSPWPPFFKGGGGILSILVVISGRKSVR
jgi:hypothetical protein